MSDFDIGRLRELIEKHFDSVDPRWRQPLGSVGFQKRVTFNLRREGGQFSFGVLNAEDNESRFSDAIRRAIDEYAREVNKLQ